MSQFDEVPQDLWPLIIGFMDQKTKRQMRATNKKWLNNIKYNNFALYYTSKENLSTVVEYLSKYSWPIELSFQKHRFTDIKEITDHLYKLTNLTKMNDNPYEDFIEDNSEEGDWMRLTTLTNIEYWDFQNYYLPLNVAQYFTKLTNWPFHGNEKEIYPILKKMANLNSLTSSKASDLPFRHLSNPSKLTQLTMYLFLEMEQYSKHWNLLPNLKELTTRCYGDIDITTDIVDMAYLTALESCNLDGFYNAPSFATLTNLTSLEIYAKLWSADSALSLKNLKKLRSLTVTHDIDRFNILADLDQLQELALCYHSFDNLSLSSLTSLTNLEKLELKHCCMKEFDSLTQLTNLKSLKAHARLGSIVNCIDKFTSLDSLNLHASGQAENNVDVDLSNLTNLTSLVVHSVSYSVHGLEHLINLMKLEIIIFENVGEYNFDFLSNLQGLTSLLLGTNSTNESFWNNLLKLTSIQCLNTGIDHDDRLLQLTQMKNLTSFGIRSAVPEFTGIHLTALTSAQTISSHGNKSRQVYTRDELLQRMPNLYYYYNY